MIQDAKEKGGLRDAGGGQDTGERLGLAASSHTLQAPPHLSWTPPPLPPQQVLSRWLQPPSQSWN